MFRRVPLIVMAAVALMLPSVAVRAQEGKPQAPAGGKTDKPTPPKEGEKPKSDKPAEGKPADPHGGMSPEDMAEMMRAMSPGVPHQKLSKYVGEWTTKSSMSHGGEPAEESAGVSKLNMILEGRFLHEEHSGSMMGMPMKSAHLLGYNNGSKKYEGVWMYTHGTNIMNLVGETKDDGKTIVCTATWVNESGIKESMTITYTFTDDDHFSWKLDGGKMPDGTAGPVMTQNYTRKK